jgi:Putative MetA-pathway of phenol degradation
MFRSVFKATVSALLVTAAAPAFAVDDGPRAYFPLPSGTNTVNVIGLFQNSNSSVDQATAVKGAKVHIDAVALQYSRTVDIGGTAAGLVVVAPIGEVRASATLAGPLGNVFVAETKSSGIGDVSVAAVVGLIGSPALTRRQYVQHKPGFSLGAMAWVTAPTGEYDRTKLINLGTNRWQFRIGAPFGWSLGKSYLSPNLTTIEVVPSVTFYSVNTAPFRAGRSSQSALFKVEGHVTHNFSRAVWGSIDLTANSGGATRSDGLGNNDTKTWMGAGITAGMNLSPKFGLSATYGGVLIGNSSAPEGDGFRVNARFTF